MHYQAELIPMLLIILTAAIAFTTTNIDDILLLMVFFAQVNTTFRKRHIVAGHYLGFGAIVVISLLGFAGSLILSDNLIRLLGFIPLALGLYHLFGKHKAADEKPIDMASVPT